MSSKLVFTVKTVPLCEEVVTALRAQGIEDDSIGVIASDQTDIPNLPDADLLENDIIPAVKRGGAAGAITGVLAGLGMTIAAPGVIIGGAGLGLAAMGGASFGVIASGLIGTSLTNRHLKDYEDAINRGELLLIVDVEEDQEKALKAHLASSFPDITLEGEIPDSAPIN